MIEWAVLDKFATPADVVKRAEEAQGAGLCVAPHLLASVPETVARVSSVCGYPDGTHHPLIKATEARFAVQNGAVEIALVPNLGAVRAGDMNALLAEVVAVREAITEHVELTVILEPDPNLRDAIDMVAKAGATCVQAGTRLSTPTALAPYLGKLPVKAVGTAAQAEDLLAAGASHVLMLDAVAPRCPEDH
ncbi:hypothetical protein [Corynebacterium sp. H130]|uniref:hypothetical protein n=1 Tax=Corynebacterium sp. H130 TaxID=3133444 RepID=UPI0030ADDDA4